MSTQKIGMADLAPGLLVAVPQLDDPNFARSVVYLIAHSDEGAFGLVLNRPADVDLHTVCAELGLEAATQDPVYMGGPVDIGRGFVLYRGAAEDDASEVQPGVQLSGEPDVLSQLLARRGSFRLYLGYAGWAPGQLEQELAAGAWLTVPSRPEYLLDVDADALWARVIRDQGIDPATIAAAGGEVN